MGTPSSVKRSVDPSGDDILTLETSGGAHVQAVVLVDDDGALAVEYAGSANNPTVLTYADAWSGRAGLVYGTYQEAV